MKLHNLKPAAGSKGREKRGYSRKIGFEGGQMPIQRRLPKFGFTNPNRVEYKGINVSMLQALSEKLGTAVIDLDTLVESGFVSKKAPVKILGNGELSAKLDVKANAFSKSAIAKIEAAGGTATVIE